METEKLKINPDLQPKKNGGARPGAGRKKGGVNQKTIEKLEVLKAFRDRVMTHADDLFNAQYSLAVGTAHVYRIDETEENGKKKREHVLVTDPDEIKEFLDDCGGLDGKAGSNDDYYYITTKNPDIKAIDSLLDRTFGKATQGLEVSGKDGGVINIKIKDYGSNDSTTTEAEGSVTSLI